MTTITQMRRELATAYRNGYTEQVRSISGIDGAPDDAIEIILLWFSLEAAKGSNLARDVCEAMKKWRHNVSQ